MITAKERLKMLNMSISTLNKVVKQSAHIEPDIIDARRIIEKVRDVTESIVMAQMLADVGD